MGAPTPKDYIFTKGINTIFNRVENCEFKPAPYDQYINTGIFFANKRNGLKEYALISQKIKRFGVYTDSNKEERLVLTTSTLEKYGSGTSTIIASGIGSNAYRSNIKGAPGGTLDSNGTASAGGADTLTDGTKSWTVNAYAGHFVWIVSGKGAGDIQFITSNTATTLTVSGWTNSVTPDSTSVYRIYPLLVETSMLISSVSNGSGGTVDYYDGTTLITTGLPRFRKAVEYDGRMWYTDAFKPSIIWYSVIGQPFIIDSFKDTGFGTILDMTVVSDYLVIGRGDKILCIKKDNTTTGSTYYTLSTLIKEYGIMGEGAINVFNNACHFISSEKNLYKLSIVSNGMNDVQGIPESQGTQLRGYLNTLTSGHTYRMFMFRYNFHILASNEVTGDTLEFIYNIDLDGWIVYRFPQVINDTFSFSSDEYYAVNKSVCTLAGKDDLGSQFEQVISFIFGVDTPHNLKRIRYMKFLFGAVAGTVATLTLNPYINFGVIGTSVKTLNIASAINKVVPSTDIGGMGVGQLGTTEFGSSTGNSNVYSKVGVIKVDIGQACNGFLFETIVSDQASATGNGFVLGALRVESEMANDIEHPISLAL